jgi:sterol desaturase/sphingolipid hydroxylase (fatty acid hydroxylase superfamily)
MLDSSTWTDPDRWDFTRQLVFWHNLPVLICFVLYTVCDCFPGVFGRFKIQKDTTSNAAAVSLSASAKVAYGGAKGAARHKALFTRSMVHTLVNHGLVIPALWFFVGFDASKALNPTFLSEPWGSHTSGGGWHMVLLRLVGYVAVEDTLFYWAHRALHVPALYRTIHKRHHEFHVPFSIAAEYAHPIESVVGNFVPFLAGPTLFGGGVNMLCLWFVVRMVKTAEAHSGYAFPLAPFSRFPSWMVTAEQHDYHHSQNVGMYGSFFCFWDRLCGTDASFRRHKARQMEVNPVADVAGPPRRFV